MSGRDDILASTEMHLKARPSRSADHQAENRALRRLAREMAARPDNILHVLCEQVLDLCEAESAGVSLLGGKDGQGDFTWPAVAGAWATYTGGGMPRDTSPCGVVIDRNASLLFHEVERDFPAVAHAAPRIREILLAPFYIEDRAIGTVWAIIHSNRKQFDREDRRLLESVAEFAAAAYQLYSETERRAEGERQREAVTTELREREQFLSSVLAASTDCIKVVELDGTLSFMSEGGMKTMEVSDFNDVRGCPWPDFLKDVGIGAARDAIEAAKLGQSSHFESSADTFLGTPKWWSVSVSPIMDADGKVARILSVSRDHTAVQDAREQQQLLNGELSHRLKNVLTLVQAIANQTLRDADNLEEASAAFAARLASLGRATDVLTATSWHTAEMHDAVAAGLTAISGAENRISIAGPQVMLNPQAAMALTLVMHELVTNAVKYGALSNENGSVELEWHVISEAEGQRFSLLWREEGGPPVTPPTRKGFGSRMIERSLRAYFRGDTTLSYRPAGVEFRIDAPLPDAAVLAAV